MAICFWGRAQFISDLSLIYFSFEKSSQYIGVSRKKNCKNKPWQGRLVIHGKQKHCGYFKTEIEAAKQLNLICKKRGMELPNPELSDTKVEKKLNVTRLVTTNKVHWGNFKTEIAAAKRKKDGVELKNPELLDTEVENSSQLLTPKKVVIFSIHLFFVRCVFAIWPFCQGQKDPPPEHKEMLSGDGRWVML